CFVGALDAGDDPRALAASLWDLDAWAVQARALDAELADLLPSLDAGDLDALAPGFVVSAAVLRHLVADPQLPPELQPGGWPGERLRRTYDRYDAAFKAVWRAWFHAELERSP